ncbi:MAG: hypothetical protein QM757_14795 [Paludibaculum sp.]
MRRNADGDLKHVPPPVEVVRNVAAGGVWPFPALEAVTETPVLRPDGTVHQAPGYDPATRLLHVPGRGLVVPEIADHPGADELAAAVALVDEPSTTSRSRRRPTRRTRSPRSSRRSCARPSPATCRSGSWMRPSPAPARGCSPTSSRSSPPAAPAPRGRSRTPRRKIRKMITSTLLDGASIVVLDNVETAIKSPALAAVLTTDTWADRVLGRSEIVQLPNRCTWLATGNNLQVAGDLARRCYRIRLDARQARPYTRTGFLHADLQGWALQRRGELVAALLTIARSWWAAGSPAATHPAMGGYTPWAATLAGILAHAGVAGFLENLDAWRDAADTEAADWEGFLAAWRDVWAGGVILDGRHLQGSSALTRAPCTRRSLPASSATSPRRTSVCGSARPSRRAPDGTTGPTGCTSSSSRWTAGASCSGPSSHATPHLRRTERSCRCTGRTRGWRGRGGLSHPSRRVLGTHLKTHE